MVIKNNTLNSCFLMSWVKQPEVENDFLFSQGAAKV